MGTCEMNHKWFTHLPSGVHHLRLNGHYLSPEHVEEYDGNFLSVGDKPFDIWVKIRPDVVDYVFSLFRKLNVDAVGYKYTVLIKVSNGEIVDYYPFKDY